MEKKEFREEFSQFMKQTGKSQKQVSKETGLSTSVISQFLDGKYTGDNGKVQDILNKFLSISKDRLNSVSGTTYYPDLYNTKEVLYACWYAHKYIKNRMQRQTPLSSRSKNMMMRHNLMI